MYGSRAVARSTGHPRIYDIPPLDPTFALSPFVYSKQERKMSVDVSSKAPAKRACDACKVRKVRCSNTTPCTGCIAIGTSCTFNKQQGTRGPRRLKAKTIQHIAESQRRGDDLTLPMMHAERRTPPVIARGASSSPVFPTLPATERPLPPLIASPPAGNSPPEMSAYPINIKMEIS